MTPLHRSTTDQQIILSQPPPLGHRLVELTILALPVLLFIILCGGVASNIAPAPPLAPVSITLGTIMPMLTANSLPDTLTPPPIEQASRRDRLVGSLPGQTRLEAVYPLFQPHADNLVTGCSSPDLEPGMAAGS